MNISNVITAELLHDIGKLMPRGEVECIRDTVTILRDYKSKLLSPEQFWCTSRPLDVPWERKPPALWERRAPALRIIGLICEKGTSTKEIEKLELSAPRRGKSKSWSFPFPGGDNRKAGAFRSQRGKSKSWSFPLPEGENRKAGAFRSQRGKSKSWSFPFPGGENRKAGAFRSQEGKIEKLELSAPRRRKSKSWSFPLPEGKIEKLELSAPRRRKLK